MNAATWPDLSLLALVLANLIPLSGVLLLNWDVGAIVVLYWAENLVIGFYTIIKLLLAAGLTGLFHSLFFLIHYGGFCAVHGLFIVGLMFDEPMAMGDDPPWPLFLVFIQLLLDVIDQVLALAPPAWIIAFAALFVSHGYSFVSNFLLGGERDRATIQSLMSEPYKRIVILHVAVIAGGFGVMALGEPLFLLLALVMLKLGLDITLHLRKHRGSKAP